MASGSLDPTEVALVQRGGVLTEVHYGTLMEPLWNHWNLIIWGVGGGTEFMEFLALELWNHC